MGINLIPGVDPDMETEAVFSDCNCETFVRTFGAATAGEAPKNDELVMAEEADEFVVVV